MTGFVLEACGPIDRQGTLAVLQNHAIPGAEVTDALGFRHTRLLAVDGFEHVVSVQIGGRQVQVQTEATDPATRTAIAQAVRWWLDLDTDIEAIGEALSRDPVLAPLVDKRPGLRVIRHPHGFEAAIMTVLGQQVSLAAARTFTGRLVAAFGSDGPGRLRRFPTPEALAAASLDDIRSAVGVTGARATTVHAVAAAALAGLRIGPGVDHAHARRALLALPGVGPWTADYLAVRAFGDPDAFTPGDLVLRRALGGASAAEAAAAAEAWRPWRAYALAHLWAEATGAPC